MADEGGGHDEGVARAVSAYMYYSRENSALVGEELRSAGKDSSVGVVTSLVAEKFKSLNSDERAPYDAMAAKDRERYNRECAARDDEVFAQQEERRKANNATETETRMRGSTLQHTESSFVKSEAPKRTRELSEHEIKERDSRRATKKAEQDIISSTHNDLKAERALQAEARLKYLLSQSDIFSHFQTKGTSSIDANKAMMKQSSSSSSLTSNQGDGAAGKRSRHRNSKKGGDDELDDDEAALLQGELDDDDDGNGSSSSTSAAGKKSTILLTQPSIITGGKLRDYQLEGLNWMIRLQENGINGILADEMGLGKTLQSISVIAFMREHLNIKGPHLVMVPKSTLSNWCNEFKRFCPSIRVIRFHGSKEEREEIVHQSLQPARTQENRSWDVCITTYEVVNLEKNALTKIAWRYLIIDEAHRLKNEASQFSQTVRLLQTQYRLLLTGTPLQNNLHELWALLNFLLPDVFSSSEQFDEWFNLDVDDMEAKQRIIGQLHKLLRPFMLRRLKADVEKSLPPKSETILFIGMSAQQKDVYKKILLRDIDQINSNGGKEDSKAGRTAILNIVMQLRKCCNHPYLFPGIEDRTQDPLGEHLYQSCGKMVLLHRLLNKLKQRDHRVLIFSQMTRMLDILEDYFISQGFKYCRIDGNTSYEEREDRIADYNREGSDKFIFLLSTRAGGLGINLQTADTVILYDSDWNPQADLQAQDRAHRIGQKKAVQVFRLVTDETVEVKVVERAQQKLKLDAMVVQQGRLQEKEKKMSKQDLLDTLRFGADKIFRSKESAISDADIDLILEEGRKRTVEMTEKLQIAEKGDMYDFRLDGGMKTQEFDGVDYSDRNVREAELNALTSASILYIDPGKRERKAVASYSEAITKTVEEGEKKQKLPKHLQLKKMDDWQFYNKERLLELHAEEVRLYDQLVETTGGVPANSKTVLVLPPELQEEKNRLLEEGFADWSKSDFNAFLKASGANGRHEYEKIARDINQNEALNSNKHTTEDVARYAKVFWELGPTILDHWESRILKNIEKDEREIESIQRLTAATKKFVTMFANPWDELTLKNSGTKNFNAEEDRFLLCLAHVHGYGNWDQVRSSVRRSDRFRFDFFMQSCSVESIASRCISLMKAAEKELLEIEKKKAIVPSGNKKDVADNTPLGKKIAADDALRKENEKLALLRDQLSKLKSGQRAKIVERPANVLDTEPATSSSSSSSSATKKRAAPSGSGAGALKPIREVHLPFLCKILMKYNSFSMEKIFEKFVDKYEDAVSKRQVENKIKEITDKKGGVWTLKEEFTKYLTANESELEAADAVATAAAAASKKPAAKRAKKETEDASKRKREDGEDGVAEEKKGPKKPAPVKKAETLFYTENKKKCMAELPEDTAANERQAKARQLSNEKFAKLSPEERKPWDDKVEEDRKRFETEMAAFNEFNESNEGPDAKKVKLST